jgi:hypothetical protein
MPEARELAVGLIRERLRQRYPDLSSSELGPSAGGNLAWRTNATLDDNMI